MALNAEKYAFSFETRGTTRAVNASSLMVQVDGDHWLVGVGRNLLRPVGRSFQLTYAAYGALCWSVANWKGAAAGILDSKLADFSFQVEFLGEIIQQLLTDELLPQAVDPSTRGRRWQQRSALRRSSSLVPPHRCARPRWRTCESCK